MSIKKIKHTILRVINKFCRTKTEDLITAIKELSIVEELFLENEQEETTHTPLGRPIRNSKRITRVHQDKRDQATKKLRGLPRAIPRKK